MYALSLPPGQFKFSWGKMLGQGGLGRVDEIVVIDSNCEFNVGDRWGCKRLNEKWKSEPVARERFEREIIALRKMSHPLIVTCIAENVAGWNERFYIMPLYVRNLRYLLAEKPTGFEWKSAARYVARLAGAMAYAHSMGFIHRDLKPENVLLDGNNNPVIADWGLGYFIHKESKVLQHLTRSGMGTEYYCSLEQWSTGKCDRSGDIYSLGLILAELIEGRQMPLTVGLGIQKDVLSNATEGSRYLNQVLKEMTSWQATSRIPTMTQVVKHLMYAVQAG